MPNNNTWDAEARLYDLECAIDTLDKIRDGLPDDRTTANALGVVNDSLCKLYSELKERLL